MYIYISNLRNSSIFNCKKQRARFTTIF